MAIQKIPNTLIADNAITATKIANGTLTADDIAANSITAAKLSASTSPTFGGLTVNSSEVLFDNTGGDFTLKLNTNAVGDKNEIIMGDSGTPLAKFGVSGTANDIITGSDGQDFNIGTAGGGRAINFSTDNFASVEMKLDGGNVGIGTDSPDSMLHLSAGSTGVSGGGSAAITMTNKFDNPDNSWIIAPVRSGVSNTGLEIRDVTDSRTDMVFDGSGNVGIGNSNPETRLHISGGDPSIRLQAGSIADARVDFEDSGGTVRWYTGYDVSSGNIVLAADESGFSSGITAQMDNSGNFAIGTSSPTTFGGYKTLHFKNTGGDAIQLTETDGGVINQILCTDSSGGKVLLGSRSNHPTIFCQNDTEAMRIDSSGDLTVGTSSLGFHFDISTQLFSSTYGTGGNLTLACTNSSGSGNGGEIFLGGSTRGDSLRNCIVFKRGSGTQSMLIDASGNVTIAGSLSKGSGSFKIDHPLESKKETHHLVHSFVEAPQADNIYRGVVTLVDGSATINLDTEADMTEGTFVLLNTNTSCFTSNESDWDAVKGSVSGNILTISCQNTSSTATVSWLVIGERQDQHMLDTDWTDENGKVIVEPLKGVEE